MSFAPLHFRRLDAIAGLALAAVAAAIYGWIAASSIGFIGFSDSADYLFFADFYRGQFNGSTTREALEFYRATRFPPLFPLTLAVLGGGTHALQHTQAVACVITIAMFGCYWWWMRVETNDPIPAALLALVVIASPGLFLLNLSPVSEPLAMALTWVVLMLASRGNLRRDHLILIGLIAGLSVLVRSINIALVAAIVIWLAARRTPRGVLAVATVVAAAPYAAWLIYRRSMPSVESYLSDLRLEFIVSELGGWPDLLYAQPLRLVEGFVRNFDHAPDAVSTTIGIVILSAACVGWIVRLKAVRLDAVFVATYLAVILVWPYPREASRFMTFILPLLLFHAFVGIEALFPRGVSLGTSSARAAFAIAVLAGVASTATIAQFIDRASMPIVPELRAEKRTQMFLYSPDPGTALRAAEGAHRVRLAALETARHVSGEHCVYATLPYLLQMNTTTRVRIYPMTLSPDVPVQQQLGDCDYFFLTGLKGIWPTHPSFFPMRQLEGWTQAVFMSEYSTGGAVAVLLRRNHDVPIPSPPANHSKASAAPQLPFRVTY